jgi:hypothetical protein
MLQLRDLTPSLNSPTVSVACSCSPVQAAPGAVPVPLPRGTHDLLSALRPTATSMVSVTGTTWLTCAGIYGELLR